ncbi:MAG: hypothetical protein AAF806_18730 [Bacteroidota bacterium]
MEYQLTAQDYLFGGGIFITMVHALLLAAILFFNKRFNTKANKCLALAAFKKAQVAATATIEKR